MWLRLPPVGTHPKRGPRSCAHPPPPILLLPLQSLALVTAKEPLRIAVANNLRTLLTNQLDANTLEQVGRGWGRCQACSGCVLELLHACKLCCKRHIGGLCARPAELGLMCGL